MNRKATQPFGRALIDYHHGNLNASLTIVQDDGWTTALPIDSFFRSAEAIEHERIALGLCTGEILDVGAGTGLHSLFLQEKGFKVYAIDIIPEAIQIMRERGVINTRRADIMTFSGKQFDTILMMGQGIGMVENMNGLDRFLEHTKGLLKQGGQVLLTSSDVRTWNEENSLDYIRRNVDSGRYRGEIRMQFKYAESVGLLFGWLHVDVETLSNHTAEHDWDCELICQEDDGNYLARLYRCTQ